MTQKLEREFARRFESNYAISFVNGTATMHATLEAMGIGIGDEVIVPPLTMAATTFAVLQANATPIFADVDTDSFQIDVDSVAAQITPATKAVIAVSLYGSAPDLPRLRKLCDERGLFLIEDNAECYLSTIGHKMVGTFGHAASYSFQSSKHVTSGEGGMVICQDEDLADRIRRVQSLGYAGVGAKEPKISKEVIQNPNYSRHMMMGWNYRLSEVNAAIALGQVQRLNKLLRVRTRAAELFSDAVEGYTHVLRPQAVLPDHTHSYWTWAAVLDTDRITWEGFRKRFMDNGGDGFYAAWKLTYMEPMFTQLNLLGRERLLSQTAIQSYKPGACPQAEFLQPRLVQLKTNYWRESEARAQAQILRRTLKQIS